MRKRGTLAKKTMPPFECTTGQGAGAGPREKFPGQGISELTGQWVRWGGGSPSGWAQRLVQRGRKRTKLAGAALIHLACMHIKPHARRVPSFAAPVLRLDLPGVARLALRSEHAH